MQEDISIVDNRIFPVLPAAVLFEAVFQRVKEFSLFFGALTVGLIGISAFQTGITMPHIIMAIVVLIGCPVLTVSGAIATGIWIGLLMSGKLPFLDFLWKYDLGRILLIVLFIVANRYIYMRLKWEKQLIFTIIWESIYNKGFLVMILAGIVLLTLQHFEVITIPELVNRIHLIKTGIISFTAVCILSWLDGYSREQ